MISISRFVGCQLRNAARRNSLYAPIRSASSAGIAGTPSTTRLSAGAMTGGGAGAGGAAGAGADVWGRAGAAASRIAARRGLVLFVMEGCYVTEARGLQREAP